MTLLYCITIIAATQSTITISAPGSSPPLPATSGGVVYNILRVIIRFVVLVQRDELNIVVTVLFIWFSPWTGLSLASVLFMASPSRLSNDASRLFMLKYRLEPTE